MVMFIGFVVGVQSASRLTWAVSGYLYRRSTADVSYLGWSCPLKPRLKMSDVSGGTLGSEASEVTAIYLRRVGCVSWTSVARSFRSLECWGSWNSLVKFWCLFCGFSAYYDSWALGVANRPRSCWKSLIWTSWCLRTAWSRAWMTAWRLVESRSNQRESCLTFRWAFKVACWFHVVSPRLFVS